MLGPRPPITIAYLGDRRQEDDRLDILRFARKRQFGRVIFVEEDIHDKKSWQERRIKNIIGKMKKADRIIIPDLTRLGRSSPEVLEILKEIRDNEIDFYSLKEGLEIDSTIQPEIISKMLTLFLGLERDFMSMRVKESLWAKKAAGVRLGRPKGPGKSKLDKNREEIINLLKNGSSKSFVAKRYNTTLPNLYNWLKKNRIDAAPVIEKIE
jgi:DNA invertase Pin-like site-specific DNA recombinase